MAVRNFWLGARIEGRDEELKGGPPAPDGGFKQTVHIRNLGKMKVAVTVDGEVGPDGALRVVVRDPDGVEVYRVESAR